MRNKLVIVATFCAPTVEGGRFKRTAIFEDDMTVKDAMVWARSIAGSAVLDCVEITQPDDILRT